MPMQLISLDRGRVAPYSIFTGKNRACELAVIYMVWEKNIQQMLRRDEDSVDLSASDKAILRESYEELKDIIKSDNDIDRAPLLQLAMGWPAGLELLLERSPKTILPAEYHYGSHPGTNGFGFSADNHSEIDEYAKSCNILLEAGYPFSLRAGFCTQVSRIQFVFLREYANRQRKLLDFASAHIPSSELSDIMKEETGLPDRQTYPLCAALMAKGIEIDHFLRPTFRFNKWPIREVAPLYSNLHYLSSDLLEKAYEFGFTDVTQQLPQGYTPLALNCARVFPSGNPKVEFVIAWLISKGANPLEKLPRSYTTASHLRSSGLGREIYFGHQAGKYSSPALKASGLERFHQIFDKLQLSVSVTDECEFPCSVGGCTTLSVAIRHVINWCLGPGEDIVETAVKFRRFLQFLIENTKSTSQEYRSIIRSLTFDGLGLNHSCCTELNYPSPWNHTREECDLVEIREEQIIQFKHLESLVAEFEKQFDTYGLPLMDFLQKIWYTRMVRFLSHSDPFDAEHHEESRQLNVFLKREDVEIPFVVQVICDQTRVIEEGPEDPC